MTEIERLVEEYSVRAVRRIGHLPESMRERALDSAMRDVLEHRPEFNEFQRAALVAIVERTRERAHELDSSAGHA